MLWIIFLGCIVQSVLGIQPINATFPEYRSPPPGVPVAERLIGLSVSVSPEAKLRYEMMKAMNGTAIHTGMNSSVIRAAITNHLKNANLDGNGNRKNVTRDNRERAAGRFPNVYPTGPMPDMTPMEALIVPQVALPIQFEPPATAAAFPDKSLRQITKDQAVTGNEFGPFFPGTFAPIPTADVWVPRPTSIPRSASFSKCRGKTGYVADFDHNCQTFFNCLPDGSFDRLSCPGGLLFDQDTLSCQKAANVICSAESFFDCTGKTGFYTDPFTNDRSSYFFCINGEKSHFRCPDGLLFNENCGACDLPQNCGPVAPASYMLSGPFSRQTTTSALANQAAANAKQNQNIPEKSAAELPVFLGKGDFQHVPVMDQQPASSFIQQIPAPEPKLGFNSNMDFDCFGRNGLFADVGSGCTSYWVCMPDGSKHILQCPAHLRFSELLGACDWPQSVSCAAQTAGGAFCADKIGFYPDPVSNCKSYYFCSVEGRTYNFTCPGILLYNEVNGACDDPQNVDCLAVSARLLDNEFDCTGRAGLFPDQRQGCKVYYSCNAYGKKTRLQCPTGQIFNEQAGLCDFERNVLCGPGPAIGNDVSNTGNLLDARQEPIRFPLPGPNVPFPSQTMPSLLGFTGSNHENLNDAMAFTDMRNGPPSFGGQQQLHVINQDVQHRDQIIPINFPQPQVHQTIGLGSQEDFTPRTHFDQPTFNQVNNNGFNGPQNFPPNRDNMGNNQENNFPNQIPFPEAQQNFQNNRPADGNNFIPNNQRPDFRIPEQNFPNQNGLPTISGRIEKLGASIPVFLGTAQANTAPTTPPVQQPNFQGQVPLSDRQQRFEDDANAFNIQNFHPTGNINVPNSNGDNNQNSPPGNFFPQNNQQPLVPFASRQQDIIPIQPSHNQQPDNGIFPPGNQQPDAFSNRPNPLQPSLDVNRFQQEQQQQIQQQIQPMPQNQPVINAPQQHGFGAALGLDGGGGTGPNRQPPDQANQPVMSLGNNQPNTNQPNFEPNQVPSPPNFDTPPRLGDNNFPPFDGPPQNFHPNTDNDFQARQQLQMNQGLPVGQFNGTQPHFEERQGNFQGNNQAFLPPGFGGPQVMPSQNSGYSGPIASGNNNLYSVQNEQAGSYQPVPNANGYQNANNLQQVQRPVISGNTGYFAPMVPPGGGQSGNSYGGDNNNPSGYGNGNQQGGQVGYANNNQYNSGNQGNSLAGSGGGFNCRGRIGYYPDVDQDCRVYHYCKADGTSFQFRCPADLKYNATLGVCDWARNVNCQLQRAGPGNTPTWNESPFFDCQGRMGFFGDSAREFRVFYYCEKDGRKHRFVCPSNLRFNDARAACDWPENIFRGPYVGEQEFDCSGKRGYFGNPNTPSVYYFCEQDGTLKKHECPDNLAFNFQIGSCDWPERFTGQQNNNLMYRELPLNSLQGKESIIGMSIKPMDAQESRLQQTLVKSVAPAKFSCSAGKYGFYADVTTKCQNYFYCRVDGKNFSFTCPNNLRFNDKLGACDLERNVPCLTSGSPGFAQLRVSKTFFNCQGKTGLLPDMDAACRTFFNCEPDGSFVTFACSDGLLFNSVLGACDRADTVQCKMKPSKIKAQLSTGFYARNVTIPRPTR